MFDVICKFGNNTRYLLLCISFVGVSKAILEAAGQAVEAECQKLGKSIKVHFSCWHISILFTISKVKKKRNFNIALAQVLH